MKLKFLIKKRYQYDPETLTHKEIEYNVLKTFFKRFLSQSVISILLGIGLFYIAYQHYEPPKEQYLKQKNKELKFKYAKLNQRFGHYYSLLDAIQERDDNMYRPVFEVDPIPASIRQAGFGGSEKYEKYNGFENSALIINSFKHLDKISKQVYIQLESHDKMVELIKDKEQMLSCIPAIRPISTKDLISIGPYGMRLHPIYKVMKMHTGVDLSADQGTNVYAAGDGVVIRAEMSGCGYGYHIRIDHGYSYMTLYGHLSEILVKKGQKVKRGDVIGLVGNTGISTRPHLHYEVRKNNKWLNPANFYYNDLSTEEYDTMIEMASKANLGYH